MKHTIKQIIRYLCYGISWGCTCFVLWCLFFAVLGREDVLSLILDDFVKHTIGSILVGIACGSTAIVYQSERLSGIAKALIHFCVGMGVFYPVALFLGWIPFYPNRILYTVLQFLISCSIFMAIWVCFYLFNHNEAKEINHRLKELEQNDTKQQV